LIGSRQLIINLKGAMAGNKICPLFLYRRCPFSAQMCNFSHNKELAPLCKRWQIGLCIGAIGNCCMFRHYYNDMDGALIQAARHMQRPINTCSNRVENYSSPLVVKVVKEVSKQRKEEVDLETGKRRSWVETTEFEVYDLTGDSPTKKPSLSLSKSPLKAVNNNDHKSTSSMKPTAMATATKNLMEISAVDPGKCPVCGKIFKGEKGVASHRRARNSKCHPSKENQVVQNQAGNTTCVLNPVSDRMTTPDKATEDNSIIYIADTPAPGNRRVSLRRSIRMA